MKKSVRPLGEADVLTSNLLSKTNKNGPSSTTGSLDGSVSIVFVKIQETFYTGIEDGGGITTSVKTEVL